MIKTKLIAALLLAGSMGVKAQFGEQGQRLIGGQFGIGHTATSDNNSSSGVKATQTNLTLSLGKFTQKNVLSSFSVFGGYGTMKNTDAFGNVQKAESYSVGAGYGRTYFKPLGKGFFFGIGGEGSISYNDSKTDLAGGNKAKSQRYSVSAALVPILSYQISNRFVANLRPANSFLSLDYSHTVNKTNSTTVNTGNSIGLNTGFWNAPLQNMSFGFSYLLKRK